jgi:hypothetical protein
MAGPDRLGRAYIEFHADTSNVPPELKRDARIISDAISKESSVTGAAAGKKFTDSMGRAVGRAAPQTARTFTRGMQKELHKLLAAEKLLPANSIIKESGRLGEEVGRTVRRGIISTVGNAVGDAISGATKAGGQLAGSLSGVFGNVGPLSGGAFLAILPAIAGLVLTLGTLIMGLLQGIALLPASLAVLGGLIAPLILTFHGLGETIQNAFAAKNAKELREALKGLTPPAREFVRELIPVRDFFKSLGRTTQFAFFKNIQGDLTRAMKNLGPSLNLGFTKVADAAGRFVDKFLKMMADPKVAKFLDMLFEDIKQIVDLFGPAIMQFIQGLMDTAQAALPSLVFLAGELAKWIGEFGKSLTDASHDGKTNDFIQSFILFLYQAIQFGNSVFDLIKALFGTDEQQKNAQSTIDQIIEMIDWLTAFFNSKVGRDGLMMMYVAAVLLAGAFIDIVIAIVAIMGWLKEFFMWLTKIFNKLTHIKELFDAITGRDQLVGVIQFKGSDKAFPIAPKVPGHASGAISTRQHLAMISEGNTTEAIIPLTNPTRARQLADQSGLTSMLNADTQVIVYIGDEQVEARVVRWAGRALKGMGQNLRYGPRMSGTAA